MNAPVIRHEQRQHQTLTPRLQQAVRLLQLSSLDFAQEVNQAMGNNPFLELDEAPEGEATQRLPSSDATPLGEASPAPQRAPKRPLKRRRATLGGRRLVAIWNGRRSNGADHDFDFSDITAADQSLRDHLLAQSKWLASSDARSHVDGNDRRRARRRRIPAHGPCRS